jgi:hypothetical protein
MTVSGHGARAPDEDVRRRRYLMVLLMSMTIIQSGRSARSLRLLGACAGLILALAATPAGAIAQGTEVPHIQVDNEVRTDPKDSMVGYVQATGTFIALFALFLLRRQIVDARRDSQGQRAFDLQNTYTGREFQTVASRTMAFLDSDDARDCVQKLRAWESRGWADNECLPRSPRLDNAKPSVNDVLQVYGFFEGAGTLYLRNEIARGVFLDIFASPPVDMFTAGWWFLCWMRDGTLLGESEHYAQYQRLVLEIRKARPDLIQRFKPKRQIAMLCLPANLAEPDDAQWERCEKLSLRLSALINSENSFTAAMKELELKIEATANDGDGDQFAVTLLPLPWEIDALPCDWTPVRNAVARAQAKLTAIGTVRVDALIPELPAA